MSSTGFKEDAFRYLFAHAIDPGVASKVGVRQVGDTLHFPYRINGTSYERRRPLGSDKTFQPDGEPLALWWPCGRPDEASRVLVCEGEPDALAALTALRDVGPLEDFCVAAIPGAGFPADRLGAELAGMESVILALDADDAGRSYEPKALAALAAARVPAVPLLLPRDGCDLADCLGDPEHGREWLVNALLDLGFVCEGGGLGGAHEDIPEEAPGAASLLTSFEHIVARPVRWAWQDRIPLGKITALAGRPKVGKGLLYSGLIAAVTRGELEGDLAGPRDVIVVTTEDDPGDTLKPRLMAAGADLSLVSFFQMGTKDDPVPFRVPQDATELSRRVKEKNAALVVIDPLLEFVDGKLDSHKSQPVRQALASVNQIARENGCAVLVIFHLNKGASTDPYSAMRHRPRSRKSYAAGCCSGMTPTTRTARTAGSVSWPSHPRTSPQSLHHLPMKSQPRW